MNMSSVGLSVVRFASAKPASAGIAGTGNVLDADTLVNLQKLVHAGKAIVHEEGGIKEFQLPRSDKEGASVFTFELNEENVVSNIKSGQLNGRRIPTQFHVLTDLINTRAAQLSSAR